MVMGQACSSEMYIFVFRNVRYILCSVDKKTTQCTHTTSGVRQKRAWGREGEVVHGVAKATRERGMGRPSQERRQERNGVGERGGGRGRAWKGGRQGMEGRRAGQKKATGMSGSHFPKKSKKGKKPDSSVLVT